MNYHDMISDTLAATPPVSVGVLVFFGVQLSQWVLLATLIYTVFLTIKTLVWLWDRFVHKKDDGPIE